MTQLVEVTKQPMNSTNITPAPSEHTALTLKQNVEQALTAYFAELDGQHTTELYDLFMQQVEAPLFTCVMQHTQDNQSKAATLLGLNRGTLRKKLKQYDLL